MWLKRKRATHVVHGRLSAMQLEVPPPPPPPTECADCGRSVEYCLTFS